ncbi:MAG: hypothetical protein LIP01_02655, partial [Tannerellaceae bacterium]|nr:hypothetical protein [Tannerellaceae bacterium]
MPMFSLKTYFIGGIILLVVLFFCYKSYQYINPFRNIHNMDIEQLEAFMASQGVDMKEVNRKDLESRIESVDFLFKDRLNQEQIERLKIRYKEQYD